MNRRKFVISLSALSLSALQLKAAEAKKKVSLIDTKKCIRCGTCYENCPVEAIEKHQTKTTLYYQVNASTCIGCGTCIENCPKKAIAFTTVKL
jgi:NAD-dependent dihydropyrimidine dehydrogenase PreA subunit